MADAVDVLVPEVKASPFFSDPTPLLVHRFAVEVSVGPMSLPGTFISDIVDVGFPLTGYFSEVSGLEAEVGVIEYKTVTVFGERITQKIPGPPKWGDVVLKKGVTDDMSFWGWQEAIQKGMVLLSRANVSIFMYDIEGNAKAKWDLDKAWPSKISGPILNAGTNEIGVEEITLVHEGIRRVSLGIVGAAASALTDFL
ncbi:MAG TPA: phage tail protein [Chloroflexi bacterium]|nr:phage tail protein [Chloroflexota bacterium]